MKTYSKHPWEPTDFVAMFNWNLYVMQLYGGMLYAFVTDMSMQRITPVFNNTTPGAVALEYMELNELVAELTRFQEKSEDRADRVGGGVQGERPMEEKLGKYFEQQTDLDKQKLFDADALVLSFAKTKFPSSNGTDPVQPSDHPGSIPDPVAPIVPPSHTPVQYSGGLPQKPVYTPSVLKDSSHPTVGSFEMDHGVSRSNGREKSTLHSQVQRNTSSSSDSLKRPAPLNNDSNARIKMFKMFSLNR
jgi:hypothetical protein